MLMASVTLSMLTLTLTLTLTRTRTRTLACSRAHLTLWPPRSAAERKLERSSCIRSSESAAMIGTRYASVLPLPG